jgi:hypothetical protein
MLKLVISGGQTGSDQAGWRAARAAGLETGGWMPQGWLTEEGSRPEFAELYGARETDSYDYPTRTRKNVEMADLTIWFGSGDSSGFWCTRNAANAAHKPFWIIERPDQVGDPAPAIAKRINLLGYKVVNVAGNRGSKMADGGAWVEAFLREVFALLGQQG